MNSLAKAGLVIAGLAFLFKDQIFAALEGTSTPAPGTAPAGTAPPAAGSGTPPATTPPAAPPAATPAPGSAAGAAGSAQSSLHNLSLSAPTLAIATKVSAAAGATATLSADEWNWYWSQASGVPQTADLFPPENRGALMSLKEYLGRRGAAGLSGLALVGRRR